MRNIWGKCHKHFCSGFRCGVLFFFMLAAALSGCGESGGNNKPQDHNLQMKQTPLVREQPPSEPSSKEKSLPFTAPLTGLGSEKELKERPVMVMVENSPAARPQTGLDQADIVYEVLAEGEITRFAAIFQSKSPEIIGPVRSIRPYFVQIGEAHDALIVHAGWSPEAQEMMAAGKLSHFDEVYGDGKYYWRGANRKPPHNLYTSIARIRSGAEDKRYPAGWKGQGLNFTAKNKPSQSSEASKVAIPYLHGYMVSYEYDSADKTYKRFMAGKPHNDKESGKQLEASNVIVCESKHRIVDEVGRREVDMNGPDKGYYFTGGRAVQIAWDRQGGVIRIFENGKELALAPGATWIQFVPQGTQLKSS